MTKEFTTEDAEQFLRAVRKQNKTNTFLGTMWTYFKGFIALIILCVTIGVSVGTVWLVAKFIAGLI